MQVQFIGNLRGSPEWLADFGSRDHLSLYPAKLDAAQFTDQAGVTVTVDTGGASGSATSVPVVALTPSALANTTLIAAGNVLLPAGTVLYFGGAKVATLTADAVIGATSLTVAALPTALVAGDVATYTPYGTLYVPSGTFVGRTLAERDANTAFGPAASTDEEFGLTFVDIPDLRQSNDAVLVRPTSGTTVKENYLPQYTTAGLSSVTNEVQTLAVDTILSGGKIGLTAVDSSGVPRTVSVAYNTSWTQTVADIQTALNALLGTSAVAVAVTATKNATFTFSGTGYAGKTQPILGVDISAATGPTQATVTRTTAGGNSLLGLIRRLYNCIKGTN